MKAENLVRTQNPHLEKIDEDFLGRGFKRSFFILCNCLLPYHGVNKNYLLRVCDAHKSITLSWMVVVHYILSAPSLPVSITLS